MYLLSPGEVQASVKYYEDIIDELVSPKDWKRYDIYMSPLGWWRAGEKMLLSDSFPYPRVVCHANSVKQILLCLLFALDVRKGCVLGLSASFMARFQWLFLSDKRFVFASSLLCFLHRSDCLLEVWAPELFSYWIKGIFRFSLFQVLLSHRYLLEHDSKPHWLSYSYLGTIHHPSMTLLIPNDYPGSVQLTHIRSTDLSLVKPVLHFWKRAERGPGSLAKI